MNVKSLLCIKTMYKVEKRNAFVRYDNEKNII